ncbi:hypothetical protein DWB84_03670 [Saccharophagus sp. K07]|jgi:mannan endo-1,4-beta-mannosidase|nr:hypothetical protein [Saccharophagus sp. K07]
MMLSRFFCVVVLLLLQACATQTKSFITYDGYRYLDGKKEFQLAELSALELHQVEHADGVCKPVTENQIKSLINAGHNAVRVVALSVSTLADETCEGEFHILPPALPGGLPRVNENAMLHYDRMIVLADKYGLRLLLSFIDREGSNRLARFYEENGEDLYDIHSKTYVAYTHVIKQILQRRNSMSGRLYRDEPAIMAWEIREQPATGEFFTRTLAFIKILDPNHLVLGETASQNDPLIP